MAIKKKIKKKQTKSKKTAGKRVTARKSPAGKKRGISKKKSGKKPTLKKGKATKAAGKKAVRRKVARTRTKQLPEKSRSVDMGSLRREALRSRSGGQSGDLQGLSNIAGADSESVDELLEEGNPFEADAVKGVEDAGDLDERGVRTHEVLEDDVPGEYLDKE